MKLALALCALVWQTNFDATLTKAKTEKKLVLVYLYTDWSGWCTKFDKEVLTDKDVQAAITKDFLTVRLNGEKDKQGDRLVKQFGAKTYPYIAFLDSAGKVLNEVAGPTDVTAFLEELQTALDKAPPK